MRWLEYAEKDALICGKRHISYKQLVGLVSQACRLMPPSCRRGERVAILAANTPEWAVALYAIWNIHAIAVPIDFMSTPEEIAYILDDCTPVAVWCDDGTEEKLKQAIPLMSGSAPAVLNLSSLKSLEAEEIHEDGIGESDDEEIALIIYTSGTTGNPKGVMLTFGNILANTTACSVQTKVYISDDRVLVVLPLHHAYPLIGSLVLPISIGATSVFTEELNANAILSALQDHQCTFIIGVPRLLELFRNSIMSKINASFVARLLYRICSACRSLALSRLIFGKVQRTFGGHIRYISCGGAAADPQVTHDFYTFGFEVLEGYGMTETAPMISFTPPLHPKFGSPGKPIPCNTVKISDCGEVLVRGTNVMKGYYNRSEETAQVLDSEGWLHTGDVGYIDDDGYLFLTGRSKELIILGNGKNINPSELEQHLMELDKGLCSECAVTDDGRQLVAIVVPDMKAISEKGIVNIRETVMDQLIEPYNELEPSYKRIGRLELWNNPLPRTRLGKLRRHIIRKQLEENGQPASSADAEAAPLPDTEEYRLVCKCLESLAGRNVKPDEHFELELGLDSLAKMTLLSSLGKDLGREIPVTMLAQHPTARSLAEALAAMPSEQMENRKPAAPIVLPKTACTHGIYRHLFSMLLHSFSKVVVEGRDNIPQGACLFAPNHQSFLDPFYLAAVMDGERYRNTFFYTISKFINGGQVAKFARRHNMVAMEINGDIRQSLALLQKALEEGKSVVVFPEGTRSMDGSMGEFKTSFAQLALDAHAPIIPVAIDGAFDILPRNRRMPAFGKAVSIRFLTPINPQFTDTSKSLTEKTKAAIMTCLEK